MSTGIVLSSKGEIILNEDFCDEVIPRDSFWQIGILVTLEKIAFSTLACDILFNTDSEGDEKVVWITITKKTPTVEGKHWKGVLQCDVDAIGDSNYESSFGNGNYAEEDDDIDG